ncbi:MAG: Zn-dependent hydrolase [Hyphomicrobiaceae bacterium]
MGIEHDLWQLLERLSRFGGRPDGGVDRPAFSPVWQEATAWLIGEMREIGMTVRRDAAGNVIGRLGAAQTPAIVIGSHIDTVPSGGRFDGALGVMAGLVVARQLAPRVADFTCALEVVSFADEEGTFGLTFGSRAMAGSLTAAEVETAADGAGMPLTQALLAAGGNPSGLDTAIRPAGDLAAYLELHIEQGPVLERAAIDIGAVEAIVGIDIAEITLRGEANHSGTTPMAMRRDALRAAAEAMAACHAARQGATTLNFGRLTVKPGAVNIVPAEVTLTQEIRAGDAAEMAALRQVCAETFAAAGRRQGVEVEVRAASYDAPARMAPPLVAAVERQARELGYTVRRMPSGAGHDAQSLAGLCPSAMIFVPSVGGISHSPKELSTPAQCAKGAEVLLRVTAELLEAGVTKP